MARILLVDDDVQLRQILGLALIIHGHEVLEAADGSTALKLIEAGPPDLVLLDWQMPEMDGLRTCQAIRAGAESIRNVPIIAASSLDRGDEALAAGANDFVKKPFDIDDLVSRINAALSA